MTSKDSSSHRIYKEDEENARKCGCEIRCWNICETKRFVFDCCTCINVKVALVFFCVVSFMQGFSFGISDGAISTFERRFHLQSSETGFIGISSHFGSCVGVIIVTYFGGRGHKPMWIAWGVLSFGVGTIFMSLPHFIAPPYDYTSGEGVNFCGNVTKETCQNSLRDYMVFLIAGQILIGVGASPVFSLVYTYLDENVKKVQSSLYHGIFDAFAMVGPGFGFLVVGNFLSIYVNIGERVPFNQTSELWIGAWWLGLLFGGGLLIVVAIPIMMLPYELPNTEHLRRNREKEMYADKMADDVKQDDKFGTRIKDFPKSFLVILRNKPLMFVCLAGAMEGGIISALSTFGPKYIQSIFKIPASVAGFDFGIMVLVAGTLGVLVGAFAVTRFRLRVRSMIILCCICVIISSLAMIIFLITCPNQEFAGSTVAYKGDSEIFGVTSSCNNHCGCSLEIYNPVCGSDNITYYSSCFAGCSGENGTCSCVDAVGGSVTPGACTLDVCPNYYLFLGIFSVGTFFMFVMATPSIQASIRLVPFNQRSFALGVQRFLLRVLGTIPVTIITGAVLDSGCVLFNEECGNRGSCKVYDNFLLAYYMLALILSLKAAAFIFFVLAHVTYRKSDSESVKEKCKEDSLKKDDGKINQGYEEEQVTKL